MEINLVSKTATTEDHLRKAVQSIMRIMDFEPPIDRIRQLVRLNQEAMSCKRKKIERLRSFLFNERAESQKFAFHLIRNALIAPITFTNLVCGLVRSGNVRENPSTDEIPLSQRPMDEMLKICLAYLD